MPLLATSVLAHGVAEDDKLFIEKSSGMQTIPFIYPGAKHGAILITTVLPAEYGINPTSAGKMLGLTTLSASSAPTSEDAASTPVPAASTATLPSNTTTVTKSDVPLRSDEMPLTLQPDEGSEIKAAMRKGEQFVFARVADGGKVNFDMHGEQPNTGEDFTSHWKARQQTSAQGTFVAPFDGRTAGIGATVEINQWPSKSK